MKRVREFEPFSPCKRAYFVRADLKRKREESGSSRKRFRSEESEALQRMLVEAYARIEQLERMLKEAKFLQEHYCRSMSNPTYNHVLECH